MTARSTEDTLPSILLTGFVFPREAMLAFCRWLGALLPMTYYIDVVRGITLNATMVRHIESCLDDVLNRGLAGLALLALMPLLGLIATITKLSSRGPVLCSEGRVGLNRRRWWALPGDRYRRALDLGGKPFVIYKFRIFHVGADSGGVEAAALTPVGRVLRGFHLDDLPQLFNVLRGDMRVVGPRPDQPSVFADLCQNVPQYPLRQCVKPGITGLGQIYRGCDRSLEDVRDRLEYDLVYIQYQGLRMDLKILVHAFLKAVVNRWEL